MPTLALAPSTLAWLALISAWACLPACQDYAPLGQMDTQELHYSLEGQALLEMPVVETPVWVVFAIDCSGSMAHSDYLWASGRPARIRAIQDFLDQHTDRPDMRFSVIRFGSWPSILTQRDNDTDGVADTFFKPDGPDLRSDLDGLLNARGWTSYAEALDLIQLALAGEVERSAEPGLTRVQAILLSDDGEQSVEPNDPARLEALLDRVTDLTALADPGALGEVRLHTVQLSPLEATGDLIPVPNQEVLKRLAQAGAGTFVQAKEPERLTFAHVETTPAQQVLVEGPVQVLVANLSGLPGPVGTRPDSDADGLADADEALLGTDPLQSDTDGDLYPDGLEQFLGAAFDPLTPNACPADLDADGDGLPACAEAQLGTDATRLDTDADGLPDGLELWAGTDPLVFEAGSLPAGIHAARVVRTPGPSLDTQRIDFRIDDLPPIPTLTGTNTLQVWLSGPEGRFRQACLDIAPSAGADRIGLRDTDFAPPRACP